jgi:hypothetical protein
MVHIQSDPGDPHAELVYSQHQTGFVPGSPGIMFVLIDGVGEII